MSAKTQTLFAGPLMKQSLIDSFKKLSPRVQIRNPVMFVVLVGSLLTTAAWVYALLGYGVESASFGSRDHDLVVVHLALRQLRRKSR